jgi:hypothetical protein
MPASSRDRFLPMSHAMDAIPQSAIRCTVLFVAGGRVPRGIHRQNR